MSCHNCTSNGIPKGCKNNGLCSSDGCNKLHVTDWLANISTTRQGPSTGIVEIRFKNGRKDFFLNQKELHLYTGDIVVVEAKAGWDVGIVSLTGDLVKVQMNKKHQLVIMDKLPQVLRKASNSDIEKWELARSREGGVLLMARKLAMSMKLNAKISDVEFQGDGELAHFYYSTESSADFGEMLVELQKALGVKIEMKQIGMRQEASRTGGIGSCGRELCCSTWLTDFRSVSTSAARYQQLSLNPDKLAGQCGKLKCCLNYELDAYLSELQKFPNTEIELKTEKGPARFQKMDIFRQTMTYSYDSDPGHLIEMPLTRVKEVIDVNKKGNKVAVLVPEESKKPKAEEAFKNAVGEDSLTRFDHKNKGKKRKKKNRRSGRT